MMRKIQLSVMLIALCLLFATYASALTPRFSPRKIHPAWLRQNPFDYWRDRLKSLPLSDAKAEKPNRRKVGEKLARLGQAAANLGAIKALFLDDDAVGVEDVDWRQGPWIVHHPGGLRGFSMSDAEAEGIDWKHLISPRDLRPTIVFADGDDVEDFEEYDE